VSLSAALAAAPQTGVVAKALRLKGQARLTTDGKSWRMLKVNDPLSPGMFLQTAMKDSAVDVGWTAPSPGVGTNQFVNFVRLLPDGVLGLGAAGGQELGGDPSAKNVVLRKDLPLALGRPRTQALVGSGSALIGPHLMVAAGKDISSTYIS
jgi:hypothetical protein